MIPMLPTPQFRSRSIAGQTPVLGRGAPMVYPTEIFARLTRESSDESESVCGPSWAPKPVNSDCIRYGTLQHVHDGWNLYKDSTLVLPGPLPRRNRLGSRIPMQYDTGYLVFRKHVFEQLDQPVAGMPLVIEPLDDEILSGIEEDVSSIRDGYTTLKMSDPAPTLERHLVSEGSAKPIFRDRHDRRQLVAKPKYCFDNGPIRLLVQTRLRTLSGNPGAR